VFTGTLKNGVIVPDGQLNYENGKKFYISVFEKEDDYPYRFRDPIHGFIKVSARGKKIIESIFSKITPD